MIHVLIHVLCSGSRYPCSQYWIIKALCACWSHCSSLVLSFSSSSHSFLFQPYSKFFLISTCFVPPPLYLNAYAFDWEDIWLKRCTHLLPDILLHQDFFLKRMNFPNLANELLILLLQGRPRHSIVTWRHRLCCIAGLVGQPWYQCLSSA